MTLSVPTGQGTPGYGPSRLVYDDAFVARYRVTAALVVVKDRTGRLRHCYRGELLDYLNDEQRTHFLRHKLVEPISEAGLGASPQQQQPNIIAAPGVNSDIADDCARDLDRLNVARNAGAPTARAALRDAGLRYANDVIATAVRARKEGLSTVPDDG